MALLLFNWLERDGRLLLAAKMVRMFAYGFLSVILAIYLKLIGFDDFLIGLILTTTLLNSVIFTLVASFYADKIGRRKFLLLYAALMSVSGFIFTISENYFALIIAAFIGTINITGAESGAFLTIEQAILPQTLKNVRKRNTVFAIYNMAGTLAMAVGVLLAGLPAVLQQHLQYFDIILNQIGSIKLLFALYSVLGIVLLGIYLLLSQKMEVRNNLEKQKDESTQLTKISSLTPGSRNIVMKLSCLFAVDSFAGGFMIQSIVSFWFFTRFGADLTTLSYIFSVSGVLTAFSFMAAAKIADRIGLINTMVFTSYSSKYTHYSSCVCSYTSNSSSPLSAKNGFISNGCPYKTILYCSCGKRRRKNYICWHYKYFKKCDSSYKSFINRCSHKFS